MPSEPSLAPEIQVAGWLNAPEPPSLAALRGRVVVALAFQMLCPGCVQYALPQLLRVRRAFHADRVATLALHTVFEHHAANSRATLEAFAHEYRLDLPIGIDAPDPAGGPIPRTMAAYASATARATAFARCRDLGDLNVFPLEPARNCAALTRQLGVIRAKGGRPVLVGGRLPAECGLATLLPGGSLWSPGEPSTAGSLAVTLDLAPLRWPGMVQRPLTGLLDALRAVPPAAIAAAHVAGLAPDLDEAGAVEASLGLHVLQALAGHMADLPR